MNNALIALYATVNAMISAPREEKGQGTLEYVGIVIVAGILVLAIVSALGQGDVIKTAISDGIDKVINAGGGGE